jgi:uncharacterized protein
MLEYQCIINLLVSINRNSIIQENTMIEVAIESIRIGLMSQNRIIILKDIDSERHLIIWIEQYMAEQITLALQELEIARPMTHDLLLTAIKLMGGRVDRVEVTDLKDDTFYAQIIIETETGKTISIDSRPSDALSLAVRANATILVSEEVMDDAAVYPEEDLSTDSAEEESLLVENELSEMKTIDDVEVEENGEVGRLSIFEDFLDNLDIGSENDDSEENE